jgi:hypothetical protein
MSAGSGNLRIAYAIAVAVTFRMASAIYSLASFDPACIMIACKRFLGTALFFI